MNKQRVLVLTGTTDINRNPSETDNTMEEVFDLTLPSKQRYAKKHGYDLLAIRNFGVDTRYGFKSTEIGFLRALRTFELLSSYDIVMWIDADSLITNDNMNIRDFGLESNFTFYASYDWYGKTSFSAGNFIVQNTNNTSDFLNAFYSIAKHFPEEQATLNALYFNTSYKNIMKILEHRYLGAAPSVEMYAEQWVGRRPIVAPWTEDAFLVHITGIPNYARLNILKKHFSKHL
jgi:hypothetical protein